MCTSMPATYKTDQEIPQETVIDNIYIGLQEFMEKLISLQLAIMYQHFLSTNALMSVPRPFPMHVIILHVLIV